MAFTPYATAVAGSVLTSAFWNQQIRDNGNVLRAGGFAITGQTANDLVYCSTPTNLNRLAAADPNTVLRGGNPPSMIRALGLQSYWLGAGCWHRDPTGGYNCKAAAGIGTQLWSAINGYLFPPGISQAYTFLTFPKSWDKGTLTAQVYWSTVGSSGTVQWYLNTNVSFGDGETLNTYSGYTQAAFPVDNVIAPRYMHITLPASFTVGSAPATDDMIRFQIMRYTDTCASDVMLLGVQLMWNANAMVDN